MRQSLPLMHFYSGKLLQFYSGVDILQLEAKIADLWEAIESCRKAILLSKLAVAAAGI
jgi:hypothetical protein